MKAVLQRVSQAQVWVDNEVVGQIAQGWLVLLGVTHDDSTADADLLVDKITRLRAFNDDQGKMNLDLTQIEGELLVVSQFTLYGNCRKGRRPSFSQAATAEHANTLYQQVISRLRHQQFPVASGRFGAHMQLKLENDGPVTLILDSAELKK